MTNKNEIGLNVGLNIDLNAVPESGKTYSFTAANLAENKKFEKVSIFDENNSVQIKVLPIDGTHFEVKADINLKRPMNCSRCGEGFKSWFKDEITEYLSLDNQEEGEDQGFLLIDSPKWGWSDFIVDSVELETPYQTYKYGEDCLKACPHYDEAVKKGWITKPEDKPNPFQALEKLKNKLN